MKEIKFTIKVPDNIKDITECICRYLDFGALVEVKMMEEPKYAIVRSMPSFTPCLGSGEVKTLFLGDGDIIIFYPELSDFIILPPDGGDSIKHDIMF